jgi:uroporphyrinogen-III synthase
MQNYVVLTRPKIDSELFLEQLKEGSIKTYIEPMLEIVPFKVKNYNFKEYQGIIFTSLNAVRVLMPINAESLDAYIVGEQVAKELKVYKGIKIKAVLEDVGSLQDYLTKKKWDSSKPLFYPSGKHISNHLNINDIKIKRVPVYEAKRITGFSKKFISLIDERKIAAIAFFSLRTAEAFVEEIIKYERTSLLKTIKALCISERLLESVNKVEWGGVHVASTPDRKGMLHLIEKEGL